MQNRRELLTRLARASGISTRVLNESSHARAHSEDMSCECARPNRGPYADYFPNVVVNTHEGNKVLFYDDLLRGKIVMINCVSVESEAVYPVMENLAKVQRILGDRIGRDVFMYSITVDPEHDSPRVLKAFAQKHGIRPGWLLLTGKPDVIHFLQGRLFFRAGGHSHGSRVVQDCSKGLIRYGNEAVGLWGSVPVKTEPEWIAKRISWVEVRPQLAGPPRRRGPAPEP